MLSFSHLAKTIFYSIVLTLIANLILSSFAQASPFKGKAICNSMALEIEKLGLSNAQAHEYVFDVVASIRSGNYMDYLEVDTPENGKRYLTTDMLLSDSFFLRKGRTQTVNFEMLKDVEQDL